MTQKQLNALLKSTGYPVAHIEFKKAPSVPFITFLFQDEEHHGSDFKNLIKSWSTKVELYVEYSDEQAEKKLDNTLSFVQFQKERVKIEEQKLIMIAYSFDDISKL